MSASAASVQYPDLKRQITKLEDEIKGGTMAAVALIMGNKLYVANVGMLHQILKYVHCSSINKRCDQGPWSARFRRNVEVFGKNYLFSATLLFAPLSRLASNLTARRSCFMRSRRAR